MDMPTIYRANAAEFMRVVAGLDDDALVKPVPTCPDWSVHDLLAHLAGSSTDLVEGNLEGVTTQPWTARQVADRRDRRASHLAAEWAANVDAVSAHCVTRSPNPAWDVTAHLDDLREALGLPSASAGTGRREVLEAALQFLKERRDVTVSVAEDGPDPGDSTWHVASEYGLWRALFSRLGRHALEREVLRGDVDAFARAAFFAG